MDNITFLKDTAVSVKNVQMMRAVESWFHSQDIFWGAKGHRGILFPAYLILRSDGIAWARVILADSLISYDKFKMLTGARDVA